MNISGNTKLIISEWIYRIIALAVLLATLYLKGHYVAVEEFQVEQKVTAERFTKLEELIVRMEEQNKVNDRQDDQLKDHEARIRVMEKERGGVRAAGGYKQDQ